MNQISAVIITFNEEKNIARCLDSLREVADEIVVVDSYSADSTEEICRSRNVRFIQHPFEGYIQQKNFAVAQAAHDYVLALDADECLSDALRQSILAEKRMLHKDCYSMNRLNNLAGKWIRHSGWYPDRKIRLWNRTKGKWGGMNPHDKVVMEGSSAAGFLKGNLLHYTAGSIEEFKAQQKKFTVIASTEIAVAGRKMNVIGAAAASAFMFLRRFFFQLGFVDGYRGFVISTEAAKYTFGKYTGK